MQRKSLSSPKNEKELNLVTEIIKSGRYFNEISLSYLKEMLRQGEIVSLNADEYLIREDHPKPPELIVLLEGSLAVTSQSLFIMRLDLPGDVVGEMSIINDDPNPFADVIAEENSKVVIFPNHLFKVKGNDTKVSVAYLMFSHILAEKLKQTTAQFLLNKNVRTQEGTLPIIGILDPDKEYRSSIKTIHATVLPLPEEPKHPRCRCRIFTGNSNKPSLVVPSCKLFSELMTYTSPYVPKPFLNNSWFLHISDLVEACCTIPCLTFYLLFLLQVKFLWNW